MPAQDMLRPYTRLAFGLGAFIAIYLILSALTNLPYTISTLPSFFTLKARPNVCSTANRQWRGANDKIYPVTGHPVNIKHIDYSNGLVNHDVSIFFALSPSEDFSIQTEIFTTGHVPADNFEITYNRDEYIINTMIPKSEIPDEYESHCVVMKIHLMIPISRPLTGLTFDMPYAQAYVHESTWGSLPSLDMKIGTGGLMLAPGQRLHIERLAVNIDHGRILGHFMLTKSLSIFLREGEIDASIGFSPFPLSAQVDVTMQTGDVKLAFEEHFYRDIEGGYAVQNGSVHLTYPRQFHGAVEVDVERGEIDLHESIQIVDRSPAGAFPSWVQGRRGPFGKNTQIRVGHGDATLMVDTSKALLD